MGEYWMPVNLTRREYIDPHDLNYGLKINTWNRPDSEVMRLIDEIWSPTDVIVAVSDSEGFTVLRGEASKDMAPRYRDLDDAGYACVS